MVFCRTGSLGKDDGGWDLLNVIARGRGGNDGDGPLVGAEGLFPGNGGGATESPDSDDVESNVDEGDGIGLVLAGGIGGAAGADTAMAAATGGSTAATGSVGLRTGSGGFAGVDGVTETAG